MSVLFSAVKEEKSCKHGKDKCKGGVVRGGLFRGGTPLGISNGLRVSERNLKFHSLEISLGHIYIINGLECQVKNVE